MIVTLVKRKGMSSIVMYEDSGTLQACIVDSSALSLTKDGGKYILKDAIASATPYGVDWNVILPDGMRISPNELQIALYERGIISIEDLKMNPSVINEVVNALLKKLAAKIYKLAKSGMEDYYGNI